MNMKKQNLPKWFNGELYEDGAEVTNPFSKEKYKLNNVELSMYDMIIGAQMVFNMGYRDDKILKDWRKGLDWFRTHSAKAYMVLLD